MHRHSCRPLVACAVVTLWVLFAGCGRDGGSSTPSSEPSPRSPAASDASGTVAPPTPSATSVPPPAPTTRVARTAADEAISAVLVIHHGIEECLGAPRRCDVSRFAVPGSRAAVMLTDLVQQYRLLGLVARPVPELSYVVPESVRRIGAVQFEVVACEVDGSWQMDSRGTTDTADDAVWDDRLVSRRARHVLEHSPLGWRRVDVVNLEVWEGVNACPRSVRV